MLARRGHHARRRPFPGDAIALEMHARPPIEDKAGQSPPSMTDLMAAELAAAGRAERLWHGYVVIWNVAALALYVCGWPGIAGLCIWVGIVISVARLVRE